MGYPGYLSTMLGPLHLSLGDCPRLSTLMLEYLERLYHINFNFSGIASLVAIILLLKAFPASISSLNKKNHFIA